MRRSLLASCCLSGSALGQFYAIPLDGFDQATGTALSADGRVVAGYEYRSNPGSVSFSWTPNGGRVDFGLGAGFPGVNQALGISGDGTTVVGTYVVQGAGTAYRWSSTAGFQSLGPLGGSLSRTFALDASGNGSVVVGYGTDRVNGMSEPFVWSEDRGMRSLGRFAGGFMNEAVAVSEDGSTVVGWSSGASAYGWTWTESGGFRQLAALPGTNGMSSAAAANRDATVVVGGAGLGLAAAMWRGDEVLSLGALPDTFRFHPTGVDDLGQVVIGNSDAFDGSGLATIWTQQAGLQAFSEYLLSQGVDLPAGIRLGVTSVSSDGRTFSGTAALPGGHAFAYVVTVPCPSCGLLVSLGVAATRRRR